MILYKETKLIHDADLRALYSSVGWVSYTDRITDLSVLLSDCQIVFSAWDESKLVGLIRTVGDGISIQYVQDFLVLPAYQKQGIGTALIQYVMKKSENIRQLVLITDGSDENKSVINYYESQGLKTFENAGICGLFRMK
ncbi:MAG: GNAT family N-acetyltransferase [Defluviitaleaceae bacterium]|nr:GNAT family N-acetyltransferase [Defluviitaleaceae bacterium]